MPRSKHFHSKSGNTWLTRKYQARAKPKPCMEKFQACSSMSSILGISSGGLGTFCHDLTCMGAALLAVAHSWQTFRSTFWMSLTSLGFLCAWSFTLTASCIMILESYLENPLLLCVYPLVSQAFLWNLGGSLHDLVTFLFCMPIKPESRALMPSSAISLRSSQIPWTMATTAAQYLDGEALSSVFLENKEPWNSLLKANCFQWIETSVSLSLRWVGCSLFLRCSEGIFAVIPLKRHSFCLMKLVILTAALSLAPILPISPCKPLLFLVLTILTVTLGK